jgi:hypothetical protein
MTLRRIAAHVAIALVGAVVAGTVVFVSGGAGREARTTREPRGAPPAPEEFSSTPLAPGKDAVVLAWTPGGGSRPGRGGRSNRSPRFAGPPW